MSFWLKIKSFFGGQFTTATDGTALLHVAVWDGQQLSQVGNGVNDYVYALVMNGTSTLYIGGQFTQSGSTNMSYIGNEIFSSIFHFSFGSNKKFFKLDGMVTNYFLLEMDQWV